MRPATLAIITAAIGTTIGLGAAEAGLRLTHDDRVLLRWDGDDDNWKRVWVNSGFTLQNPRIVPDAQLGWVARPAYRGPNFNLNSRGQRGLREYAYEKPAAMYRVVVLGDSFTFGSFGPSFILPDSAVYTARLERCLGIEVVNLAVDGYAVDQQLLMLRSEGLRYEPDLVIAAIYEDNVRRSLLSFRDYRKPRFELENDSLRVMGIPVPLPEEEGPTVRPDRPASYLLTLLEHGSRMLAEKMAPLGVLELDRLNLALLDALKADVERSGARLLVMSIPHQTYATRLPRTERIVIEWSRRSGAPFLDLRQVFLALPAEQQAQLYRGHLTPFGHEAVSRALLDAMTLHRLMDDAGDASRMEPARRSICEEVAG